MPGLFFHLGNLLLYDSVSLAYAHTVTVTTGIPGLPTMHCAAQPAQWRQASCVGIVRQAPTIAIMQVLHVAGSMAASTLSLPYLNLPSTLSALLLPHAYNDLSVTLLKLQRKVLP